MRPIVLVLTVWLPVSAGAMELGSIPTPATRMQRGTTCTFAAGQPPRCSDGRLIATARDSECMERAGDTWTTRPVNTACVDDDGMQAYQRFTNYWVNSTNPSVWSKRAGPTVAGAEVTDTSTTDFQGLFIAYTNVEVGDWTASCFVRPGSQNKATLKVNVDGTGNTSGSCKFDLVTDTCTGPGCQISSAGSSKRISCRGVSTGTQSFVSGQIFPADADLVAEVGSIFVDQCQLTKGSFAMPRHDCGATVCSRAPDLHTISTAGWPTTSGEICIAATPGGPAGTLRWLIDGRAAGVNTSTRLYVRDTTNRFETTGPQGGLAGPVAVEGVPVRVCFGQRGGQAFLRVGASLTTAASTGAMSVEPNAFIGVSRSSVEHLNGTIRRLSWSAR